MLLKRLVFLAGLLVQAMFVQASVAQANTFDVFGLFLTEERNSVIQIEPCADSVCGTVVWLNPASLNEGDTPETATSEAGEKILGLTMLQGFTRAKTDWREGTIYDPGKDKTYASRLKRLANGSLEVKGCISFFCQTQIWTRVENLSDPLAKPS